jgi:RNA polymerase sigma-70 factor (ECF subfamily)
LRAELEQIYRQHRQALYSLALTMTGCAQLAEDSVHEAFAGICRAVQKPRGDLVAYVYASVRNAAIDRRKTERRQKQLAESIFAARAAENDSRADDTTDEQRERLHSAIESLDLATREILVMKIYGNLTLEAISLATGEPAGTIASRYRRAIEKIRDLINSRLGVTNERD